MKRLLNPLFLIIIVSAVFRLWGLSSNPPHLTSDEAALGYNAYSILMTGRDEHGVFMPLVFESFGDWKPGLYIYLTVPFVAIFGLNEFSTRIVGAISGVFAVYLIYLATKILFNNYKWNRPVALLSAGFLALSPWHLQFTRGAWESGVALTLVIAGIYFFLKAISGNNKYLYFSISCFALTTWAYQGAKLATLIVVFTLLSIYGKEIFKKPKKVLLISFMVGVIIGLPILVSMFQGKAGRLEIYSVFSYPRPKTVIEEIINQDPDNNALSYNLYHSEPLNFTRGVLGRWLNHYSGRFLIFEGDWNNNRHSLPDMGLFLFIDIIFLVGGLVYLLRQGFSKPAVFVLCLLLFSPIPAALSRDSVHAVRAFNLIIPLTILLSLGAYYLFKVIVSHTKWRLVIIPGLILIYATNYIYYLDQYWVHAPYANSGAWGYGHKQIVEKVRLLKPKYSEIVMKQDYTQPYIYFLFYDKYDPATYQALSRDVYTRSKFGDVGLVSGVDGVIFRDINWNNDRGMVGKLFIIDPIKVPVVDSSNPNEFKIVEQIKYLNNNVAFRFIEPIKQQN